jgi:hypothetical protein
MYMSVLLIGITTFGFFSVTLNNFLSNAEELTLEGNLDEIIGKVSNKILLIVAKGEQLIGNGGEDRIVISFYLEIPNSIGKERYTINIDDTGEYVVIYGLQVGNDRRLSEYNLGILSNEINFSGQLRSDTGGSPVVTYVFDRDTSQKSVTLANL